MRAIAEGGDEPTSVSHDATVEDEDEAAKSSSAEISNQAEAAAKEPACSAKY